MRVLFWLLVIALVLWAIKRPATSRRQKNTASSPASPQDMVVCLHCGVHLPQDEAVRGSLGLYCGTAHRSAAGDRNPQ